MAKLPNEIFNSMWNKGYQVGAKEQRQSSIEHLSKALQTLEDLPGIGEKRAWQIREHFMQLFMGR